MKLKKIASLALAGVMAVSMLAGCATKAPETNDNQDVEVETSTTSIAAILNGSQTASNEVKVTFTEDATLADAVQQAVNKRGVWAATDGFDDTYAGYIKNDVIALTGMGGTVGGTQMTVTPYTFDKDKDGDKTVSVLSVKSYALSTYAGVEAFLLQDAAKDVDTEIKALDADNSTGKNEGDTYYTYSYTGKSAVVTVKNNNGAIYYLVATVITRTGTEGKI